MMSVLCGKTSAHKHVIIQLDHTNVLVKVVISLVRMGKTVSVIILFDANVF